MRTDGEAKEPGQSRGKSPGDRARAIVELVAAEAEAGENLGRLTDKTVSALRDSGLLKLQVPRCFGGLEASAVETIEALEIVSQADGSTGWVLMAINLAVGTAAGYLSDGGASSVFGEKVPIIAGQGVPRGRAVPEGDGYRLSGQWSYGSGVLHADYLHTGGVVYDGEKPVGPLIFIVPTREATIIEGWDVIGLRATGSIDYSLDNVYVPKDCTHPHRPMIPNRGSDLFRIGIVGMAPLGHGAFALGVGRCVLDEAIRYATGPDGRPGTLNDGKGWGSFEEKYAAAEGKLRAGRAFLYEAFREVEATIERQDSVSNRQITHIKLALSTATTAAMDACEFVYRVGGGLSLRNSVVQRCLRDMLAASQHRIVSDFFLRECARELLGTAPGEVWTTAGLAAPS